MKSTLLAGLLMGTMAVGTMAITFNGENTINSTTQYIKDTTQKLQLFKTNEGKLVDALTTLKTSKKALLDQITTLEKSNSDKQVEIATLSTQIVTLNTRIAELEKLLASGGTNNEELQTENNRLKAELEKANIEITKANNLVNNLQSELNNQKSVTNNIQPMTGEELDKLINENTTPTTPPTNDNYDYTIDANSDTYYFQDITISVMGNLYIFEGTAQYPVVIYLEDGTTINADPNGLVDISKKVIKIQYKTTTGTTKIIKVNR